MRAAALLPVLLLTSCVPVDAIDQSAKECEQVMLPRIFLKVKSMPADALLKAKRVEIEHQLDGGEKRLKAIQGKIGTRWRGAAVEPVDEITFGLFLREDAVGFADRAESRTKELCAFAEANRVKYQKWSYAAPGFADSVSQTPNADVVTEVATE